VAERRTPDAFGCVTACGCGWGHSIHCCAASRWRAGRDEPPAAVLLRTVRCATMARAPRVDAPGGPVLVRVGAVCAADREATGRPALIGARISGYPPPHLPGGGTRWVERPLRNDAGSAVRGGGRARGGPMTPRGLAGDYGRGRMRCIVWRRVLDSALPSRAKRRGPLAFRSCLASVSRPNRGPDFEGEDSLPRRLDARERAAERSMP
jgi:hypothetical protein